ncbi:similar to stage IV sporulation protein [Gracilibacillus ureilyticus]|uniref:Similar to stage IV sporulation protein n=1 Tax=Gracilibacillus ureilyticus TaxID=531814 RepID=A0A1H9M2K8_9BACI|nr:sporulation protein YqfD [Gracilibacillus ureilyticus]SER17912.1 similar to stage IV sporulation protein [Gracilibacillus ureilyticus]
MFYKKKNWYSGTITIKVIGEYPELFFDLCTRNGIKVWDIVKTDRTTCLGDIDLRDIPKLRKVKRKTIHKVYFKDKQGLPFLLKHTLYQKPLLIGFMIAVCFIFLLSNMVWRVDVSGLDEELENKVMKQLQSYGVTRGNFQWNIGSPGDIQDQLIKDIPELLWIGVTKNGTAYHLEGVEKTRVEKDEEGVPGHLVATKEGVIVDIYAEKGQPLVKVNDVVKKNDILISAYLNDNTQAEKPEEDDDEELKSPPLIAEGEVIAKVWYKSTISVPLEDKYDVLTGETSVRHYVNVFDLLVPVWNFRNPEFEKTQVEADEKEFYFLNWKIPVSYVKRTILEKEETHEKRTEEAAMALAKEQALRRLKQMIPLDAKIEDEKVLHERVENGKVKLTIYYTVLEDITKRQPLTQGD